MNAAGLGEVANVTMTGGWAAAFTMTLGKSPVLLTGLLVVTDPSGAEALRVVATSGAPPTQDFSDLWTVDHGPLPANPDATKGNWIETTERTTPKVGREFKIGPESVKQPVPPYTVRDQFRVHWDAPPPGSAGCIAIIGQSDFDAFAAVMRQLLGQGISTIPLVLVYS
jgi:hypothetical protein